MSNGSDRPGPPPRSKRGQLTEGVLPGPRERWLSDAKCAEIIAAVRRAKRERDPYAAAAAVVRSYAAELGISTNFLRGVISAEEKRAVHARAQGSRDAPDLPRGLRNERRGVRGIPRGGTVSDYYDRSTYCPVCHRDFGKKRIPVHGSGPRCPGSREFGVSASTIGAEARILDEAAVARDARTRSGGLPGLGRRS